MQHLVGGADPHWRHLVGALCCDQVGNLGDDLDIGLLEIALAACRKASVLAMPSAAARRRGVGEQIATIGCRDAWLRTASRDLADLVGVVDSGKVTDNWPWH